MTFRAIFNAPSGAIRHRLATALLGALALSACVPIPIPSGIQFMPNPADLTVPAMDQGGCGFGPEFAGPGYREFGSVRVSVGPMAPAEPDAEASAVLHVNFSERSRTGRFQSVSLDPAQVRLEEAGRSYAVTQSRTDSSIAYGNVASNSYFLRFPRGTGFDDDLRFVFSEGAVVIDGSPVAFGPVRFERRQTTSVYMFPCIPS